MSDKLLELADALRERLRIIGDETGRKDPASHLSRLQKISEQIEAIEGQLPREIDPRLRHYLQRRSYSKALEQIESLAL